MLLTAHAGGSAKSQIWSSPRLWCTSPIFLCLILIVSVDYFLIIINAVTCTEVLLSFYKKRKVFFGNLWE